MASFNPQYRENYVPGHLTVTLYRISQAVTLLLREKARACGLSPTQVQALLFLAYARPGVHTIGGLAERLGCTPATASGVVDALERKGLVIREPWPQHRRTVTLSLTDGGAAMAARVDDSLDELESIVCQLPEEQQATVLQATRHIVNGLAEHGWIKVYEMCWKCNLFQPNAHPDHPTGPHHCTLMDAPVLETDSYAACPDYAPMEAA
jgi:DNA-binding MarR family transcriptional regulator